MAQLCVICGVNNAKTKEHIPSKGLYPKPIPNSFNLHTVPCCLKCNNNASKDDEVFKVILNIETVEFRDDYTNVIKSTAKTLGSNNKLAKSIFGSSSNAWGIRKTVIESLVGIPISKALYERVILRFVKGIYWRKTKHILSNDDEIFILPHNWIKAEKANHLQNIMLELKSYSLNNDTFIYKYLYLKEQNASILGMQLFSKHTVYALIIHANT